MNDSSFRLNPYDLSRLEDKVDKMAEAVQKLVLVEERQTGQGDRITKLEKRASDADLSRQKLDQRIDRWMNIGIGAWAVVAFLVAGKDILIGIVHVFARVL